MDHRTIGCEIERWMDVDQDRFQWRDFLSALLNLRVLLPPCLLLN